MSSIFYLRDENSIPLIRYWSADKLRWCSAYSVEDIPTSELTNISTAQCLDMLDHLKKD